MTETLACEGCCAKSFHVVYCVESYALEPIRKEDAGTCKNRIGILRLTQVRFGVPWSEKDHANFWFCPGKNLSKTNETPLPFGATISLVEDTNYSLAKDWKDAKRKT